MRFSLITVTMGERTDELARLKASLDVQSYKDFEWIVVNHKEHPEFGCGLSKARNFGIAHAKGDVLAFPDDDAWYGKDVLLDVAKELDDPQIDGISFRVVDENGACSAGGWMGWGKETISKATVWHTAVSCSFFVKRSVIGDVRFDDRLGVGSGTCFGSGEETDFLLSLVEKGARLKYDGTKRIFHPAVFGNLMIGKGWRYGNGYGAVLRKHHYPVTRLMWGVFAQLARAAQSFVMLRLRKSVYHLAMSFGRIAGYVSGVGRAV